MRKSWHVIVVSIGLAIMFAGLSFSNARADKANSLKGRANAASAFVEPVLAAIGRETLDQ